MIITCLVIITNDNTKLRIRNIRTIGRPFCQIKCIPLARPPGSVKIEEIRPINQVFFFFLKRRPRFFASSFALVSLVPTTTTTKTTHLFGWLNKDKSNRLEYTLPFAPRFMFYHVTTTLFACAPVFVIRPFSFFFSFCSFSVPLLPCPFIKQLSIPC